MKRIKLKTTFKESLPKKPGRWPKMEIWQAIPEGFLHVITGEKLTEVEFEKYQDRRQDENIGYIIKSMNEDAL